MSNTPDNTEIYSVTRLNREVRAVLEGSFRSLWVKGEISNLAIPASGHMYFSLKDESSQVRCAMFKNKNRSLKFKPENGDEVLLQANVSLYEGRGEYQLIVQDMEPAGLGALQKAFEQLKEKLAKEGLFDEKHKKPIPAYPHTIGVITSPTGAAIRDILITLKRRYPLADIIVYPVPVQGVTAADEIAAMIARANQRAEVDVLILARGGGSLEDLWSFNEETVARSVFGSSIPIISGVGHEIDFTIADFVSDLRAPTPTSAAEHASQDFSNMHHLQSSIRKTLLSSIEKEIQNRRMKISILKSSISEPTVIFQQLQQRIDRMSMAMKSLLMRELNSKHQRLSNSKNGYMKLNPLNRLLIFRERLRHIQFTLKRETLSCHQFLTGKLHNVTSQLEAISPLATLGRGYSIAMDTQSGDILRSVNNAKTNQTLDILLADGKINTRILNIHKKLK
ncbi:MAG: exodeoxyribonuclease VII large subunit [Thiotrichales bacterium]|nr:exodeoxyribonuclease VII large subunit [Thiotrichales bacterium]